MVEILVLYIYCRGRYYRLKYKKNTSATVSLIKMSACNNSSPKLQRWRLLLIVRSVRFQLTKHKAGRERVSRSCWDEAVPRKDRLLIWSRLVHLGPCEPSGLVREAINQNKIKKTLLIKSVPESLSKLKPV